MSVTVSVAGQTYTIPETGETGWGAQVTAWIQKVSNSTLQTTGGTFTLTSDIDFGASYGLKSAYFVSRTANAATSGVLRLANTDTIGFRNAGNTANIALGVGSADGILAYNGVDLSGISLAQTLTNKTVAVGSNHITGTVAKVAQFNASTGDLEASAVSNTALGYISTLSSDAQTQISAKVAKAGDTMTGPLVMPLGSAAAPSITPTGVTNTGPFFPTTAKLAWSVSGTEMLRLTSSGLGINLGGSDPTSALQVKQISTTDTTGLQLTSPDGSKHLYFNVVAGNGAVLHDGGQNHTWLNYNGYWALGSGCSWKWDHNSADANTDPTAIKPSSSGAYSYDVLAVRNTSATAGNFGAVAFVGSSGSTTSATSAIVGVQDVHTSASETGHLEFYTRASGGTLTKRLNIDATKATFSGAMQVQGLTTAGPVSTDASGNLSSAATLGISNGGTGQATRAAALSALMPATPAKGTVVVYDGSNWVNQGVGTDTYVLTADSAQTNGIKWAAPSTNSTQTVFVKDVKASTTAGGTFTSGAWRTRDLNTLTNIGSYAWVSVATNQVTLTAGTYVWESSAPAYGVYNHKTRLQNVTDATTVATGTTEYSNGGGNYAQTRSVLRCSFTIAGTKTFELQHYSSNTNTTSGFGIVGVGDGSSEIYSEVMITKINP